MTTAMFFETLYREAASSSKVDDLVLSRIADLEALIAKQQLALLAKPQQPGVWEMMGAIAGTIATRVGTVIGGVRPPAIVWGNRTGFEKVTIATIGCYGLWLSYDRGYLGLFPGLFRKAYPGWRWFARLHLLPEKFIGRAVAGAASTVSPESVREGSAEVDFTIPSWQVKIGYVEDGEFVLLGGGVRYEDYLVAPDHVMAVRAGVEVCVRGPKGTLDLKGYERVEVTTDMGYIKLTDTLFSTMGTSKCKVGALERPGLAKIVCAGGKGTTGKLYDDPQIFGGLIYEGTTLGGYSGCGYVMNDSQCIGIHQRGGRVNGGLSMSYIVSCIKLHTKAPRLEASEEQIFRAAKGGRKIRVSRTGDPDVIQVHYGGKYELVDASRYYTQMGSDAEKYLDSGWIQTKSDSHYDDRVNESTDASAAFLEPRPGVSSMRDVSPPSGDHVLLSEILGWGRLSQSQKAGLVKQAVNMAQETLKLQTAASSTQGKNSNP